MKTRIFFMVICFLISATVQSQESNESTIIISEKNLISLIKTIKEKRDAILLENEKKDKQQFVSGINTSSSNTPQSNAQQQAQLNAIYAKLQTLEYDMKLLSASLNGSQKATVKKGSVTVVTTPESVSNTYSTITTDKNKTNASYSEEISTLEKKITVLKKQAQENVISQQQDQQKQQLLHSKKQEELNNNYDELLRILNSIKSSIDTLVIEKRELSDYPELMKKFDSFQSEIYFDNNSKEIKVDQIQPLDKITTILKSTDKIDVYLKGFASNKGNPVYNQNLSVQRTESVKKYLVKKGIHPSRILTQYHGIDYEANNEELARRVELSFIIRK